MILLLCLFVGRLLALLDRLELVYQVGQVLAQIVGFAVLIVTHRLLLIAAGVALLLRKTDVADFVLFLVVIFLDLLLLLLRFTLRSDKLLRVSFVPVVVWELFVQDVELLLVSVLREKLFLGFEPLYNLLRDDLVSLAHPQQSTHEDVVKLRVDGTFDSEEVV